MTPATSGTGKIVFDLVFGQFASGVQETKDGKAELTRNPAGWGGAAPHSRRSDASGRAGPWLPCGVGQLPSGAADGIGFGRPGPKPGGGTAPAVSSPEGQIAGTELAER